MDLAAPGENIWSTYVGADYYAASGTSMATPHVAGVTALWAQKLNAGNALTFANLSAKLVGSSVTSTLKAGFDPFDIGAGIVQAPQS